MSEAVIDHKIVSKTSKEFEWKTILFNCDCHTFETVIEQLMKAIGCDSLQAQRLAWVVHSSGSATVFRGKKEDCERVANVLGRVGLLVKVVN